MEETLVDVNAFTFTVWLISGNALTTVVAFTINTVLSIGMTFVDTFAAFIKVIADSPVTGITAEAFTFE